MQNKGAVDATDFVHSNNDFVKANALLPGDALDSQFSQIRKMLRQAQAGSTIPRDEKTYFTYIAPSEFGDKTNYAKVLDGTVHLYILYVMRYRDKDLPFGQFIWTEKCWFILPTTALAICDKHNTSFVE